MNLSPEREEKIIQRYTELLNSMLNEMNSWYPDKESPRNSDSIKDEHGNFVSRIASLALELGYNSWAEMLYLYGWNITETRTYKVPVTQIISAELAIDHITANLSSKLEKALKQLDEWYPDKHVENLRKEHDKYTDRLSKITQNLGYESWKEALRNYGYETGEENRGGRPASNNYDEILSELAKRYETEPKPATVAQLREENPDLAGKIKTLQNDAVRYFGKTSNLVLAEYGILDESSTSYSKTPEARQAKVDAAKELYSFLVTKYKNSSDKPSTILEIEKRHPERKDDLRFLQANCQRIFGAKLMNLLKRDEVLGKPIHEEADVVEAPLSDEEIEALIKRAQDKYLSEKRCRTATEFWADNKDLAKHKKDFAKYAISRGTTLPDFLLSQELLSKLAYNDSITRPAADITERFGQEVGFRFEDFTRKYRSTSRIRITGSVLVIDSEGDLTNDVTEQKDNPIQYLDMLRIGDPINLTLNDNEDIEVDFCGYKLGFVDDAAIDYLNLKTRMKYPDAYAIVNNRVYAAITSVTEKQSKPYVTIKIYLAESQADQNIINGVLISKDGKTALACITPQNNVALPEGIERIEDGAFYKCPIHNIQLPQSLLSIGNSAFAKTKIQELFIPENVESIGVGAFSYCLEEAYKDDYIHTDGPIKTTVSNKNTHFCSVDGTLIESTPTDARALSVYYSGAPAKRKSSIQAKRIILRIPNGVTILASGSVASPYRCFEFDIRFPESLRVIEEDAIPNSSVTALNIPKNLTDVAHDFWRYVGGGYSEIFENLWEVTHGELPKSALVPLDEIPIRNVKLTVDPNNPRYSIRNKKLIIGPMPNIEQNTPANSSNTEELTWNSLLVNMIGMENLSEYEKRLIERLSVGDSVDLAWSYGTPSGLKNYKEPLAVYLSIDGFDKLAYVAPNNLREGSNVDTSVSVSEIASNINKLRAEVHSMTPRIAQENAVAPQLILKLSIQEDQ